MIVVFLLGGVYLGIAQYIHTKLTSLPFYLSTEEPITHTPAPPQLEDRPNMGTIAINPDGTFYVFQHPAKGSKGFIHGDSVLENLRIRLRDAVIEYGNLSSTKVYFDIDSLCVL